MLTGVTVREGQELAVQASWRGPELSQGGSKGFLEEVGSCGSEDSDSTWCLDKGDGRVRRGQNSVCDGGRAQDM